MFEAQYVITQDGVSGITIFSPWFPRRGDRIRYTLDVVDGKNAKVAVTLFHKNSEDTGDGSTTGSSIASTVTVGRTDQEFTTGLKELVRYQFVVKADSNGTLGFVAFRMLPPIWFDAVSTT